MFKLYYFFILIITLTVIYPTYGEDWPDSNCGKNASHNLFVGQRRKGDSLLFQANPRNYGSWLRSYEETIKYPIKSSDVDKFVITNIEIEDKYHDGYGGCPSIVSGGEDFSSVTILVTSGRLSHGYNFDIKIYGITLLDLLRQQGRIPSVHQFK